MKPVAFLTVWDWPKVKAASLTKKITSKERLVLKSGMQSNIHFIAYYVYARPSN